MKESGGISMDYQKYYFWNTQNQFVLVWQTLKENCHFLLEMLDAKRYLVKEKMPAKESDSFLKCVGLLKLAKVLP